MTKHFTNFAAHLSQALGLALFISVSQASFAEEIYKSVDKHGNVTYSDTKTNKHAEKVKLPTINTQPATKPTFNTPQNREQETPNYQIVIMNPVNGQTLHNNQRTITVEVNVSPALKPGFFLQPMLDGALHGAAVTSSHFTISELHRGEHTLSVTVIDSNGNILTRSAGITLYVKRPSLNSPARKAKAQT